MLLFTVNHKNFAMVFMSQAMAHISGHAELLFGWDFEVLKGHNIKFWQQKPNC